MDDIATELFGPSPQMPNEEFNEAAVLDDALMAAGFTAPWPPTSSSRSASPMSARWWRSHGGRLLLDRCDDRLLARCRELIAQNLKATNGRRTETATSWCSGRA